MRPSPRLYLAEHWPGVRVFYRVLDRGHWGRTVWTPEGPVIYLRCDLGPIARRVTLSHEIGHLELGPPDDLDENERQAVKWTARFLLPDVKEFARTLAEHDERQAAKRLQVTRTVLLDRIDAMTEDEREVYRVVMMKATVAA